MFKPSSQNEQAGIVTLTESDRHQLLSSDRRTAALEILAGKSAPVELEELATSIAELESDGETVDEALVERVAIGLHHNHLPKMNDLDLIDYDAESNRVTKRRYRSDALIR